MLTINLQSFALIYFYDEISKLKIKSYTKPYKKTHKNIPKKHRQIHTKDHSHRPQTSVSSSSTSRLWKRSHGLGCVDPGAAVEPAVTRSFTRGSLLLYNLVCMTLIVLFCTEKFLYVWLNVWGMYDFLIGFERWDWILSIFIMKINSF